MKKALDLRSRLAEFVHQIGGEATLRVLIREFYDVMSRDILIGFFFEGRDLDTVAMRQCDFILKAAGLVHKYSGKPPHEAHVELPPILAGHFDRRIFLLDEFLLAKNISPEVAKPLIEFENAFRSAVVSE